MLTQGFNLNRYKLSRSKLGGGAVVPFISDALHYSKISSDIGKDLTGTQDRTSIMTKKIVGDGSMYIDTGIVPVDDADFYWEVKGNFITTSTQTMGTRSGVNNNFYFGIESGYFKSWIGSIGEILTSADTNVHVFKMYPNKFFIDNTEYEINSIFSSTIYSIFLLSTNNAGSKFVSSSFNLHYSKFHYPDGSEIIFTGEEITSPTTQSSIVSTDGEHIAQAYLTHADWVQNSIQAESVCDNYGYTLADGSTLYKDEEATTLYDENQPVSAKQLSDGSYSRTECKGYDSEGNPFPLTYFGRIKHQIDYGITLNNEVTNGDFSDGTTGWLDTGCSLSTNINILTATQTAGNDFNYFYSGIETPSTNDKVFLYAKTRSPNADNTGLYLRGGVLVGTTNGYITQLDVFTERYEIVTIPSEPTGDVFIAIRSQFSDTLGGYKTEVDGNAGVFAINMTALGIEDFTEEQMLALVQEGYFEGEKLFDDKLYLQQEYPLVSKSDLSDVFVDDHTADEITRNVVDVDDLANVTGDYLFVEKDESGVVERILMYDRALTETEKSRI